MTNLICNICNKNVDKFLYYNNRDNVLCPFCNSAERDRFCHLYFMKQKNTFTNVLHIAPEKNISYILKRISANYISGDINPEFYKYLNLNTIRVDITELNYINVFDCVFMSHVFEHVVDDVRAMNEIYKSLVVGGKLITLVPQKPDYKTYENNLIITEEDRLIHFGQKDHVRFYGLDFSKRLKAAGFYVKAFYVEEVKSYIDSMELDEKIALCDTEEKKIYGFNQGDIIYECIKLKTNEHLK